MDDPVMKARPKYRPVTVLAGGCLLILYLALCIATIVLGRGQVIARNSPTATATVTATPHILVRAPSDQNKVLYEDFSSNERNWGLDYSHGKLEVIQGKLILQSNVPNGIGVGTSKQVVPNSENYYIQADFSTDIDTFSSYGLIFAMNRSLSTFYLFEIWPQSQGFRLLRHNSGKWSDLISFTTAELNDYPLPNTLSVYFSDGKIDLYINGALQTEYYDKEFYQSKDVGLFVNSAGYRLIVDNFFVYDVK